MRYSASTLGNPVYKTSLMSALPSPSVSFMNRMSGALVTMRPPFQAIRPLTSSTLSAKIALRSTLPSPSVSSRSRIRERAGFPGGGSAG